jgi:hypothetical protein
MMETSGDPGPLWKELATAALLGSERQSPALPGAGSPLGDVLAGIDGSDRERSLLAAAAAVSLYLRAGRLPPPLRRPEEPCPDDDVPGAGRQAALHLEAMLGGEYRDVLPEWLEAVARAGKRAPEESLPDLLDLGRNQRDLRQAILPVLGKRGSWLAAQNTEWSWVAGEDEREVWETGARPARILVLERLRSSDPDLARELLLSTWTSEPPEERAAFIGTFAAGLSQADEPFLEAALDDRRKEVRSTAASLLACLPGSRLAGRMLERLRPLVRLEQKRGLLGIGRTLEVGITLPDACDRAMVRDGIEPKAPPGRGEKAWWLEQMIGAVPARVWCEMSGAAPPQLVEAGRGEWKAALVGGWMTAARRHRDLAWTEALLSGAGRIDQSMELLVEVLPRERREALAVELLEKEGGPLGYGHPALIVLRQCPRPWSVELARAALSAVRRRISGGGASHQKDWEFRELLHGQFGLLAPVSMVDEAVDGWPAEGQVWQFWSAAADRFLKVLQFRHEMLKELQG